MLEWCDEVEVRKSSKASVFGFYSMAKYMGIKCGGVKRNHKMCGRLDKLLSQTLYHFLWLNTTKYFCNVA